MGRTKKKSMDTVLHECCIVFWEKGYDQTSMKDLEKATDLKPGSLYHYFKNKEQLFQDVLNHYKKSIVEPRIQEFLGNEENNPLVNLRNVFDSIIDLPCDQRWIGCLMTNSTLSAKKIPQVKKMIGGVFSLFEEGFLRQINRVESLRNKPLKHRKKLAKHLLLSMQGFFVLVRLGVGNEELKQHVDDTFYFILN